MSSIAEWNQFQLLVKQVTILAELGQFQAAKLAEFETRLIEAEVRLDDMSKPKIPSMTQVTAARR